MLRDLPKYTEEWGGRVKVQNQVCLVPEPVLPSSNTVLTKQWRGAQDQHVRVFSLASTIFPWDPMGVSRQQGLCLLLFITESLALGAMPDTQSWLIIYHFDTDEHLSREVTRHWNTLALSLKDQMTGKLLLCASIYSYVKKKSSNLEVYCEN